MVTHCWGVHAKQSWASVPKVVTTGLNPKKCKEFSVNFLCCNSCVWQPIATVSMYIKSH